MIDIVYPLLKMVDKMGFYRSFQGVSQKQARVLNHDDIGLTDELKMRIMHLFPDKSSFEK